MAKLLVSFLCKIKIREGQAEDYVVLKLGNLPLGAFVLCF